MARLFAAAFYAALVVVAVLSLLPGQDLPAVGLSDKVEHLTAYTVLAIIAGLRWPSARAALLAAVLLVLFSGGLELAQSLVPGRTTDARDLAANSAGVVLGFLLVRAGRALGGRFA